MKVPHLLRVTDPPDRFASLVEAARAEGLRVGWLELSEASPPLPLPEALESAAGLGVLRAVAVGGGRAVAVKPLRGAPVLRDLLREHFLGCALVLVRGDVDAPLLRVEGDTGDAWLLEMPGFAVRPYRTDKLIADLRSPKDIGASPPRP